MTAITAAGSLAVARRTRGLLRDFALTLFGLSALDALCWFAQPFLFEAASSVGKLAVELHADSLARPIVLVASTTRLLRMSLHWPSFLALGVDENLERHGKVATSAGLLADYLLWAVLLVLAVRAWRHVAARRF